jgi:hypothetical protein
MCLPILNLSVRYDALSRGWCVAYVGDVRDTSASRPCRFTAGERAPEGWVDPRAGQDDKETLKLLTLPGLGLRPLCRSVRSQSPDRLRYRGSASMHSTLR